MARDLLAKRGYEGEELESQLQDFLGSEPVAPTHADAEAITRAQQVGAVSGQPTSIINPEALSGVAAIEYALEQKENKRK